jgi:4'-phosphopantetheinyl transferase
MIQILYTQYRSMLSEPAWDRYFLKMPQSVRDRISRYRRWEDRQAGLFGKLLLGEGLMRQGYADGQLRHLVWEAAGRPFLDLRMDFNISHSGEYVVCALSPSGRVGIDIEEIRPIEIADFKAQMTCGQWEAMTASENRLTTFYSLWTQKEAVAKADGRGIGFLPDEIVVMEGKAILGDAIWEVKEVRIAEGYCCHLATSILNQEIYIEQIRYG